MAIYSRVLLVALGFVCRDISVAGALPQSQRITTAQRRYLQTSSVTTPSPYMYATDNTYPATDAVSHDSDTAAVTDSVTDGRVRVTPDIPIGDIEIEFESAKPKIETSGIDVVYEVPRHSHTHTPQTALTSKEHRINTDIHRASSYSKTSRQKPVAVASASTKSESSSKHTHTHTNTHTNAPKQKYTTIAQQLTYTKNTSAASSPKPHVKQNDFTPTQPQTGRTQTQPQAAHSHTRNDYTHTQLQNGRTQARPEGGYPYTQNDYRPNQHQYAHTHTQPQYSHTHNQPQYQRQYAKPSPYRQHTHYNTLPSHQSHHPTPLYLPASRVSHPAPLSPPMLYPPTVQQVGRQFTPARPSRLAHILPQPSLLGGGFSFQQSSTPNRFHVAYPRSFAKALNLVHR